MGNTELRPIANYDNYLVSNTGDVYSLLKNKPRERQTLTNKIQTQDGRWWVRLNGFNSHGYRRVELNKVAFLETTYLPAQAIADLCQCKYDTVKRCKAIRKVQRPSEYDYRRARFTSLGVGNSVPEAQRTGNG